MGGWLWVSCKSYCTLYKSLKILSISVSCKVASWNRFQGSDFTFKVLWLSCKTETLCSISNLPTPPSATPGDPDSVSSSLTPLYNTYAWNCMALFYYHGLISSWIRISSLKSLGDYIYINYIVYKRLGVYISLHTDHVVYLVTQPWSLAMLTSFGSYELPTMNLGGQTILRDPVFNSLFTFWHTFD